MLLLPPQFSRSVLLVSLESISKPRDRVLVRLSEAVLADNPDTLDVNSGYNSRVRRHSLQSYSFRTGRMRYRGVDFVAFVTGVVDRPRCIAGWCVARVAVGIFVLLGSVQC